MKITPTLNIYLMRCYLINLLVLLLGLLAIIYLFDTVELIRRASKHPDVPISLAFQMGLFKLLGAGQVIFPFAILFSAMYTFWQLTRRYELIVVRASGFSAWQFLTPIAGLAIVIGIIQLTIINPVGAALVGKYESLERQYLVRESNQISVFREGLWLRQAVRIQNTQDDASTEDSAKQNIVSGYVILHAEKITQPDWELQNVTALFFTDDNNFVQRIDAKSAILDYAHKSWVLRDLLIHKSGLEREKASEYRLPTALSIQDIEESFSSPKSMSFWRLPDHIRTVERTGFDATRLKVYYQNLISQPLLFAAMVLLAATVSMRPPRSKGTFITISAGVFIGFTVFFLSSFLQALGSSGQIPVLLAAWSPAMICLLLGLSAMLTLEDG